MSEAALSGRRSCAPVLVAPSPLPSMFAALFAASPDAILIADEHGRYVEANPAALVLLGYTREEVLDLSVGDVVAPGPIWAAEEYTRFLRDGTWQGEVELCTKDGLLVPAEARAIVVADPAGTRYASFLRDITSRKRAEAALQAAEAKYRTLVEQLPAVVYLLAADAHQTPIYFSPRHEDLTGYSASETLARTDHWLTRVHPEDRQRLSEETAHTVATAAAFRMDYRHLRKDGSYVWVQDECVPIQNDTGQIIAWQGVILDITEQRQLQAERDRLHAELQVEVQRAAEIQTHLLPRAAPAVAGYEFAGVCVPARQIGGDFFDWAPTTNAVRLSLGDVMGKGMAAALLMATARATLKAVVSLPAVVAVETVNHTLFPDLGASNSFITLFHAHLEVATGVLTYVDAGHGLALIQRQDGTVESLCQRQLPLGILVDAVYQEYQVTLEPGDTLLLFSDGLPDARPELGLDHAGIAQQLDPASAAQEQLEQLVALAGSSLPDDLTLVLVRRLPVSAGS